MIPARTSNVGCTAVDGLMHPLIREDDPFDVDERSFLERMSGSTHCYTWNRTHLAPSSHRRHGPWSWDASTATCHPSIATPSHPWDAPCLDPQREGERSPPPIDPIVGRKPLPERDRSREDTPKGRCFGFHSGSFGSEGTRRSERVSERFRRTPERTSSARISTSRDEER